MRDNVCADIGTALAKACEAPALYGVHFATPLQLGKLDHGDSGAWPPVHRLEKAKAKARTRARVATCGTANGEKPLLLRMVSAFASILTKSAAAKSNGVFLPMFANGASGNIRSSNASTRAVSPLQRSRPSLD